MLKIDNTPVDDKINKLVVKSRYVHSVFEMKSENKGRNFLFHLYAITVIKLMK